MVSLYSATSEAILSVDFDLLFDNAPNPYVLLDENFNIVGMNRAYLTATMREKSAILGQNLFDAFPSPPGSTPDRMLKASLNIVVRTRQPDHLPLIPYPITGRDGALEERYWSASHTPIIGEGGQLFILQHTVDVTEFQRLKDRAANRDIGVESGILNRAERVADQNLKLSKERESLHSLFAQAPSFMAVLQGPDHVFTLANHAYLSLVGRKDILGKSVAAALPEVIEQGFIDTLDTVFRSGEAFVASGAPVTLNTGLGDSSETRYLNFVYQPIREAEETVGIFVQGHDVTEQKLAEARLRDLANTLEERVAARTLELTQVQDMLRQSQKMDAIGNLAGGIAHDFNNLLQIIQGSLQLLSKRLTDEKSLKFLDNALMAASRGGKLSSQLLAFGRRQPLEPKVINLSKLVSNMHDLLRRSIGDGIEVETVVSDGLWNTFADPTNVETALLNLAINARDAMGGHGKLTIELGNADLSDPHAPAALGIEPGQYVVLAVADTGSGIPPEILEKVFDPFFTTKPAGKGTGLGLSMIYGFAKQSGGHVSMSSEQNKGTTVRLYLPRSNAPDEQVDAPLSQVTGGSETVLIVEDDTAVRETAAELLRELGYKVLLARDGASGLAILESGAAFDLLFTDVVMPGPVQSTELANQVREQRPQTAILFNSGFGENLIVHDGKLDAGLNFLSKPYTREQLARKVRHVLDTHVVSVAAPARRMKAVLCEDEIFIRMVAAEMLEELGFEVIETGTIAECLRALDPSISLLVCDINLPDGRGSDLADKARKTLPTLPVIFATGASLAPPVANSAVVQKPYGPEDLKTAIQSLDFMRK